MSRHSKPHFSADELRDRVWKPLGDGLATVDPAEQRARLMHTVAERKERWRWQRWAAIGLLGAAATAASASMVWLWMGSTSEEQTVLCRMQDGTEVRSGDWVRAVDDVTLRFPEGSRVVLRAGGHAQLARVLGRGSEVRVRLESGEIRSQVRSAKRRSWTFRAGPFHIRVVGTRLGIRWVAEDGQLTVDVERGVVRVWGGSLDNAVRVTAGQRLRADLETDGFELERTGSPNSHSEGPLEPRDAGIAPPSPVHEAESSSTDASASLHEPIRRRSAPHETPPQRWKKLADAGRYRAALDLAVRDGFARILRQVRSGWDLLLLADVARLSGDASRARQALRTLQKRFRGSRPARLGLYRLGRIALQDAAYDEAVRSFGAFVREFPDDALLPDALGQLMRALKASGKFAEARRIALRYLALQPGGPYRELAEGLLQQ